MAKHLRDRDIERIVKILDGWRDKLNWEALCKVCANTIGTEPARQTLYKIVRIRDAFDATKIRLKEKSKQITTPPNMRVAIERIERLTNENSRLKRENDRLLEQFVVWQYNAHVKGLSDVDLNRALPAIDRGQTA